MITIKVKLLKHGKGLSLPRYATDHSAGVDLYAAIDEEMILRPMERRLVPTGIAIALANGYEAQIRPRSGIALKYGVTIMNSPGTIDADYRGEIKICLINLGQGIFTVNRGDRIAQMVIAPVVPVNFSLVDDLDETDRDSGGFGSTGV